MQRENLERWLEAYGRAWETLDPPAAAGLFAEDATYLETPFVEPLKGRAAIREYWQHVARTQEKVHFRYEIVLSNEQGGVARWNSRFVRLPMRLHVELDGIFLLTFDAGGRCTSLREWWHRREISAEDF